MRTAGLVRRILFTVSAATLAVAGVTAADAAGLTLPGQTRPDATVTLTHFVPRLPQSADQGRLPANARVSAAVMLTDQTQSAEQRLYSALYTPGSPSYHQFLTPAEFQARFAAPAARQSAVSSWLTRGGLRVTFGGGSGYYWVATGTASQVEALFGVQLHNYRAGGQTFYANDRAPRVPAGLGIEGVSLTDGIRTHTAQDVPNPTFSAAPQDLWGIYHMPGQDTGQGEQLGIIGDSYVKGSDAAHDQLTLALRDFEKANKLPQVPLRVIYTAGVPASTNTGALGEWELDTQASSGMAPNALDIDFYDAASNSLTDLAAEIAYWAHDPNGPHETSASLGACEDNPAFDAIGAEYAKELTTAERQAVIEGRTLFAATGDTGSGCILAANVNGVAISPLTMVQMPAAIPYTVAVGGTVLYPQLRSFEGQVISDPSAPRHRALEYSWTHGGGGASHYVAEPSYQQNTAAVNVPCLYSYSQGDPPSGVNTCRGIPDVAAMSGDIASDSYTIWDRSGSCSPAPCSINTGGTSLSSPLWLGMWARVQAAATTPHNQGLGFANPLIYAAGNDATRYANDFFDVTVGDNGVYHAAPGWDYTTGWGVPNVDSFARDLTGNASLRPTHAGVKPPPVPTSGGSSSTAKAPVTLAACLPLWTHPAGQDTFTGNLVTGVTPAADQGQNPQLSLLTSHFALTGDRHTLRMQLVISNLSKTLPSYAEGDVYWGIFSLGGSNYYGSAEVDPSGTVYYSYGTETSGSFGPIGPATGSFGSGPNGIVEVDLPLSDFGNPALGTALTHTGGETFVLIGANGDTSGQLVGAGAPSTVSSAVELSTVDMSPNDGNGTFTGRTYQVGEICAAPAGHARTVRAQAGRRWSGAVATFSDARLSDAAGEFRATITWGDGSTSTGAVTGGSGTFTVLGTHTWRWAANFPVRVSLRQVDDPQRPAGLARSTSIVHS